MTGCREGNKKRPRVATRANPTSPEADSYRPSGAGIYDRLLKSSAMVLRKDETGTRASRGSGSLVDREHKLVLTNYHVVDGRILSFDAEVLETTSPTNPGDSGGPLVNDSVQL